MDLQFTLQRYALQLKNQPHTLKRVARVFQKIMKTLYDTYFPNAEARRPGRNSDCPDADILTVAWLLEYIGEDSENSGYRRIKAELKTVFPSLPERSRLNRRRRNLSTASEVIRRALTGFLPKTDVFIVDSFRCLSVISNVPRLQSLILSGQMAPAPSRLMDTVRRKALARFSVFVEH